MKIVGIPFSEGNFGRNKGCEKAPERIFKMLEGMYNSESGKPFDIVNCDYAGCGVDNVLESNFYLGGDHTITYYTFKKFLEKKNAGLLVFDAHPDCFVRKSDTKVSHQDWILKLVGEGVLKGENIVIVGVRVFERNELDYMKKKGIRYFTMKQIFNNVEHVCDSVMEIVRGFKDLYLSVDIDCVDPSNAPGTGCLEPGGLTSRELIYFLQRIRKIGNIKCMDVVEVNPEKDVNDMASKLAARLILEVF